MSRMSHADILHARHVPGAASGRAADGTASKRQNLATAKATLSRAGNNGDSALTPPCWVKRGESVINGQGIESIPGAYCECSHHDS